MFVIVGGYVIRTLKLTCGDCASFVTDRLPGTVEDSVTLISTKNRGGLVQPHPAVIELCIATEKTIRFILQNVGLTRNTNLRVTTQALSYILLNNIHHKFTCSIHSTALVSLIVKRYTLVRIHHETTKFSANSDNKRSKLSRLIVFSHI